MFSFMGTLECGMYLISWLLTDWNPVHSNSDVLEEPARFMQQEAAASGEQIIYVGLTLM